MKALVFDSGTLINFSMNGLLYILEALKPKFKGKFLITAPVKYEVLDRPIKVPRFKLEALRVQRLIKNKVLESPDSLNISPQKLKNKTAVLMEIANQLITKKGKPVKIVSEAEMSCLALSSILTEQGINNLIAVDERTTRILSEKPLNLKKIMSRKLHQEVDLTTKDFSNFKDFKFIRSSELAYVAHKLGVLKINDPQALEAVLFATKYKGSSISHDEIQILKKL